MTYTLKSLFGKVSAETFLKSYLGKKHYFLHRKQPGFYRDLFTFRNMDEVLTGLHQQFRQPDIILKKDGGPVPRETYCSITGGPDTWYVDMDKVLKSFLEGQTIVVNDLRKWSNEVRALCRGLERELNLPVNCNAYLSPPNAKAGGLHYDDHDVIILQTSGTKAWRIYEPPYPHPIHNHTAPLPRTKLIREMELREGDLLYLPRGVPHETETSAGTSVHLTVGLDTVFASWVAFLREAIDLTTIKDVRFRRVVREKDMERQFAELVEALGAVDPEEVLTTLDRKFLKSRPPSLQRSLLSINEAGKLDEKTEVRVKDEVMSRLRPGPLSFTLCFNSRELEFLNSYEPMIRFIIARKGPFTAAQLPGTFNLSSRLTLLRQLVTENFLEIVPRTAKVIPFRRRAGAIERGRKIAAKRVRNARKR